MKLKNVLLMGLSLVLVAAIAVGGTVAYLISEVSDVNVMTLGNVSIAQHEYERVVDANGNYTTIDVDGTSSYKLKEFSQGKPLLPFVGSVSGGYDSTEVRLAQLGHNSRGGMSVFPAKNVQDKFVVVENTGKTDAYVRTIVAFEAGSVVEEDWCNIVSYSYHFTWKETKNWFVTEINGSNYYLVEFVYNGYEDVQHPNGVLTPGDYTYNSLAQVYMFDTATNEDVEALDGNKNGLFDILVLSQAVQAAGFSDARTALDAGFGAFNETNVKEWFGDTSVPTLVSNDAELQAAIEKGAEEIVLESGNYGVIDVRTNRAVTIAAASGADVTIAGISGMNNNNNTSNITIKGVTIDNSLQTEGWFSGTSYNMMPCVGVYGGNYTFENCTFYVTGESKAETGVMTSNTINKGVMNFTNCTFEGGNNARAMQIYGNYDLNVTGCTFKTGYNYSIKYVGEEGTVATFENNTVTATTDFVKTGSASYAGANYKLVFVGNNLATGINTVKVEHNEGQTIIIDGETMEY